ncbi:hypothetical protein ROSINTL182_09357 [Roseburia intestinalis L1-82]|uniref:Uncharacterized protein n=1 Tax=Roseburia intestinalis L1-82 TaxID=536231 RepID=C7GHD6_9FIRM|nr:hypothetical protein ROSINTL182_09357 [Roseburia intestinalis L1-82]
MRETSRFYLTQNRFNAFLPTNCKILSAKKPMIPSVKIPIKIQSVL